MTQGNNKALWVENEILGRILNKTRQEFFFFHVKKKLDFQVENQPRAAYISRKALVPICQCPSQEMSELKVVCVCVCMCVGS